MRVLITGGTGFIGSRLALRCIEKGFQVRTLSMENTAVESYNRSLIEKAGAEVVITDITKNEKLIDHLSMIDVVYHLAAIHHEINVPDKRFWDVNVKGTKNLLEASKASGVKRFIHGSTIGVYGTQGGVLDEGSACKPENIYGVTKLAAEEVVLSYNEGLPVIVIRIPEVYGPGDRRLLKLFLAVKKKRFFMIGDGKNFHHLIYIDDLIEGLFSVSDSENVKGQVLLLTGPKAITTNKMVQTIGEQFGVEGTRFRLPTMPLFLIACMMEFLTRPLGIQPPLHRRRLDFFIKSFQLSSKKAQQLLDLKPKVNFGEGVRRTVQWYTSAGLL